jgi:hypothetical protein
MSTQDEQRMTALAKANIVRTDRAKLKRSIADGETTIAEALEMDCAQSMTVFALLQSQWLWGSSGRTNNRGTKVRRVLSRSQLGPNRLVRDLTPRQREALCAHCRNANGPTQRKR